MKEIELGAGTKPLFFLEASFFRLSSRCVGHRHKSKTTVLAKS